MYRVLGLGESWGQLERIKECHIHACTISKWEAQEWNSEHSEPTAAHQTKTPHRSRENQGNTNASGKSAQVREPLDIRVKYSTRLLEVAM